MNSQKNPQKKIQQISQKNSTTNAPESSQKDSYENLKHESSTGTWTFDCENNEECRERER